MSVPFDCLFVLEASTQSLNTFLTPSTGKESEVKTASTVLVLVIMGLGLLGCRDKKRGIVTDMYPEEQKKLEGIVKDIFISAKNKDLDRLDSYHLNTPKFTKVEESEIFTRRNFQEARKAENDGFSAISDFVYETQDFKADVFGHAAVTTFYFQYTAKMGETPIGGRLRGTLVFVKVGDDWKIVHEHFSLFPTTPG